MLENEVAIGVVHHWLRLEAFSVGQQRFRCLNSECPYQTFGLDSAYPGRKREVKQQIVEMTLNGSGVRDIARVLHVSPATVVIVQGVELSAGNKDGGSFLRRAARQAESVRFGYSNGSNLAIAVVFSNKSVS